MSIAIALDGPAGAGKSTIARRAAKALGRRRLDGCTLYVTLEPCPMCAGTIAMSGLDRVYFGAYDVRMGCAGSLYALPEDPALGAGIPCMGGVLGDACEALMTGFFGKIRE